MLRPSAKKQYRIARLVIRTHAVPTPASAHGSSASATATTATPAQTRAGCRCVSKNVRIGGLQARSETRSPSSPDGRKISTVIRTTNANTSW